MKENRTATAANEESDRRLPAGKVAGASAVERASNPGQPTAPERLSTKERILDAAEALFSEHGYHGVSIRDITRRAGVELALANYHFGPKEELFRQVFARRAEEHCAAFEHELDRLWREAGDRPPTPEAVIRAFCVPIFHKAAHAGPGWKAYVRLMSRAATSGRDQVFLHSLNERYDPVVKRFIAALRRALPAADDRNIHYAFYFLQGALVYILAETGTIDRLSGGLCDSSDYDALLDRMVPFFAAGFYSLAGRG